MAVWRHACSWYSVLSMKRVLLISYAFPPEPLPGAQRPGYLARYLPKFGWQPTVITPQRAAPPFPTEIASAGTAAPLPQLERVRALLPGGPVRRALAAIKDTLLFPDELAPWIRPAVLAGLGAMRRQRYDAILSTALPTSAHVVGGMLSRFTGVPWIADYRDLWSGNPYMPWSARKRRLQRVAERRILARAAALTTISQPLAEQLQALHRKEVSVIPNAFDAAEWSSIPDEPPTGFDFVYAGMLYGGKRNPQMFLEALRRLKDEGHPLARAARVHFYGKDNDAALEHARNLGLEEQVFIHGMVSRERAMQAQRRAAVLLIFLSMDPATANETGSKYLEYLGARRPMLVFGPAQSVMREMMEALGAGFFASTPEEAVHALKASYARFESGVYETAPNMSAVTTAEAMAGLFAQRLDRVALSGSGTPNLYEAALRS